jgi:hypothetical protein
MKLPFSWVWYKFNNHLGSFPSKRNMKTIEIFDSIIGTGLDIGHDGNYSFKNGNVVRLNIYSGDCINIVCDGETFLSR